MTNQPRTTSDELRSIKRLIYAALAVVVVIGAVFYKATTDTTNDIIQARTDARLVTCHRDNDQADRAVDYARGQALALIGAAGQSVDTNLQAAAYLKASEDAARVLFPKRSCTKQAIDDYYKATNK